MPHKLELSSSCSTNAVKPKPGSNITFDKKGNLVLKLSFFVKPDFEQKPTPQQFES